MGLPAMDITANTTLGAMLTLSAAFFQAGLATLVGAEGSKLDKITAAVLSGSLSSNAITTVNQQIVVTMAALSSLQSAIQQKIAAGTHLHEHPEW